MGKIKIGTATIYLMLLLALWCSGALVRSVLAVSAEEKDFIILGRTTEDPDGNIILAQEMVDFYPAPGATETIYGQLKSGTVLRVIQKIELEEGVFWYNISTFGRGGGLMGWVREEYIYAITDEPPRE